jgi:tetratricopeptide (TPR) repeat protein
MRLPVLFALALAGAFCATGAVAVDNLTYNDAPDLASVRAKIKAEDYKAAIEELTPMLASHQHADVYNLMGFSLRKTGDYKQAYTFYRKALDFDPDHKGALEYLGELYVETGQIEKAKGERGSSESALSERLRGTRRPAESDRQRHCQGKLKPCISSMGRPRSAAS